MFRFHCRPMVYDSANMLDGMILAPSMLFKGTTLELMAAERQRREEADARRRLAE